MLKHTYFFILTLFISGFAYSQSSLYMPLDIKKSYDNGIHSYDGTPGPNYWQNHCSYNIEAKVEPKTRLLSGSETIEYYNESPDTLREIVLRLYQDLNKPGNSRDGDMPSVAFTEGTVIDKLEIGDELVNTVPSDSLEREGTNMAITLKTPILPHSKVTISSSWHFTIPKGDNIRMGTYDSTTFYIAYWYPQVAVYDAIHGWDNIEYRGLLEFYNEFSDFDVYISVPNNFCTWSTGVLENPDEVMTPETYGKYKQAQSSTDVVKIISPKEIGKPSLFASTKSFNTWHYKVQGIPDFAFGISDHYLWDGVSDEVEPGRTVFISAAYNPSSKDFYSVCGMSRKIIDSYSKNFPAVPFPYPKITIFNGDGGMEFPMMVNDGSYETFTSTIYVTAHEIAHTYFPFYMGIDERRWAWMDEGWAQELSFDIQTSLDTSRDTREYNITRYLSSAGMEEDIPMMVPSDNLGRYSTYRSTSYLRPGEAYDILRNTLGDELFGKALHEYMKRWQGKHPMPYDFFFTFNEVTGENLDWFWKPWFFEFGYPDLGISSVTQSGKKSTITIVKIGSIPIPVALKIIFDDQSEQNFYKKADIWKSGIEKIEINVTSSKKLNSILLGDLHIPDADSTNNKWP